MANHCMMNPLMIFQFCFPLTTRERSNVDIDRSTASLSELIDFIILYCHLGIELKKSHEYASCILDSRKKSLVSQENLPHLIFDCQLCRRQDNAMEWKGGYSRGIHNQQENSIGREKEFAAQLLQCNGRVIMKTKKRLHTKPFATNMTQTHDSEQQFLKWVKFVGSLNHTIFKEAKNKIFPSYTLTVSKNPVTGDFTSIQDAIDSLPFINLIRVAIKVKAGIYTEKVNIPTMKSFITIEGEGAGNTVVQWGDTAQTVGPDGSPLGTLRSATFAVNSPYFIAKNITFKNTTPVRPPGGMSVQAVAFRISADTAAFFGCNFLGAQDTLYDHVGRHYYKDCYIEGSVDFIFGNGLSLFEGCHVHAIAQNLGALTAQGRSSMLEDTGFSFVNCKVTGSGVLYLGRAWRPFSRVIFAYTYMDNIILPKGWYNWGDPLREMTVFYGQYKCKGPGANFAGRVAWSRELTDEEAKPFVSLTFIDGSEWIRF